MIRVIRGQFKGAALKCVPDPGVRPMPQKLKEALFQVIEARIPGSSFLDGFAGTGSIGIEALSRGAGLVVFIDEFYPSIKVLKRNLAKLAAEDKALVMHQEFNRAVIRLAKDKAGFDLIVLDPPYRLLDERNPLRVIRKRGILKPKGQIILRRHRKTRFEADDFERTRVLTLGDDSLDFFS
ncbi:MAG: 16S rRNA (guanine(966)-N(2))-methyltransferase RsmD [Candidatus Aminicenantes bacterium]|nr:16S rRNA (guanine(966)-N(2))-methyltransferase RsmD [Candidatus Aminicenantes bacterium]